MANYYTGSVSNYADLRTALLDACTDNGWSLSSGILSKGGAYARPYASSSTTTTEGTGLLVELGTGQSGSSVTGASGAIPRLGGGSHANVPAVTFPATYFIFVFTDPDEVYCILRFDTDRHYYINFGNGGLGGAIWVDATLWRGQNSAQIHIDNTAGGAASYGLAAGIPWWTTNSTSKWAANAIRSDLDSEWSQYGTITTTGMCFATYAAQPQMQYTPNTWNGDSPLVPIAVYQNRPGNKRSLVLQLQNARYVRVDNYESGDIITLGADQWMVFPGYRKNVSARDGGSSIGHTGTFGWALRYIEP